MGLLTIIDRRACDRELSTRDRVVARVPAHLGRFVPNQLIRSVLPAIRRVAPESVFSELIAPWRAVLGLVFGRLTEPEVTWPPPSVSSVDEQVLARSLSARITSHLTHNIPMHELLWEAYTRFLVAAHAAVPFVIVIDDLGQLDSGSAGLLSVLLRTDAQRGPDVVVGYTLDGLPERPGVDGDGIVWGLSRAGLRRLLGDLRRTPHRAENGTRGIDQPCRCPVERDVWDRCPEQVVDRFLNSPAHCRGARDAAMVSQAILEIFSTFAFDAALRLALEVRASNIPMEAADRACICGVAATSAHNRQFASHGNKRLAGFLQDLYCEALLHESDPARRLCLHYRLAVTYSRRLGDLSRAQAAIDAGLGELAVADIPKLEKQLQEAWLQNVHALVRVRGRDPEGAFTCCERAFVVLTDVATASYASAAEVELSKLVICENALTLASMTRNEPLRELWLARSQAGLKSWPSLTVVNLFEQQRAHIDRLEIARARELGILALDLARAKLSTLLEYFVLVSLSDLSFRLADYEAAAAYGDRARSLGHDLANLHGTAAALELRAAEIAEARGLLDDAELLLRNALAAEAGSSDLRAEVSGRLARLHAKRGHHERALEIIAETIDLTADTGELDLLLRASCHAGEVADLVVLPEDASAAYANCLELLDHAGASTPAREVLRLRAVLGQARQGQTDPSQLATCVQRLPRLLAEEGDAWPLARELVKRLADASHQSDLEPAWSIVAAAVTTPGEATLTSTRSSAAQRDERARAL